MTLQLPTPSPLGHPRRARARRAWIAAATWFALGLTLGPVAEAGSTQNNNQSNQQSTQQGAATAVGRGTAHPTVRNQAPAGNSTNAQALKGKFNRASGSALSSRFNNQSGAEAQRAAGEGGGGSQSSDGSASQGEQQGTLANTPGASNYRTPGTRGP